MRTTNGRQRGGGAECTGQKRCPGRQRQESGSQFKGKALKKKPLEKNATEKMRPQRKILKKGEGGETMSTKQKKSGVKLKQGASLQNCEALGV